MKKVIVFLILIIIVLGILVFKKNRTEAPTTGNNGIPIVSNEIHCALTVSSPTPESTVTFPLELKVVVAPHPDQNCRWTVFEAQAGFVELFDANNNVVKIKDSAGLTVTGLPLSTTENWMTTDPVTYTVTLEPVQLTTGTVKVKITEEDVQGDGQYQTASFFVTAQ